MSRYSDSITSTKHTPVHWNDKPAIKQITVRGTVAGLVIGSLVLISNFQFGLQTGWVSMMSLPSALLAVAFFKQVWPKIYPSDLPFTDVETVYIQSMAVAVGTGPLSFGFVGVIPAIEKFVTWEESGETRLQGQSFTFTQLITWSISLAFFGIFFAVPLRKQVIVREKLPFPSGSATAVLISVLTGSEVLQEVSKVELIEMRNRRLKEECSDVLRIESDELTSAYQNPTYGSLEHRGPCPIPNCPLQSQRKGLPSNDNCASDCGGPDHMNETNEAYNENILILMKTFAVASIYTVTSYFLPILNALPVFGRYLSETYLWNFQPSPAYVGQGIIMGLPTVSYMLFGAILGWGILAPLARHKGWVDPEADVHDWEKGIQGWILWCSLSIMVVDSVVGFIVITVSSIVKFTFEKDKATLLTNLFDDSIQSMLLEEERAMNRKSSIIGRPETVRLVSMEAEHEVDSEHLVQYTTVISGFIISSIICLVFVIHIFGLKIIPYYAMLTALLLALFFSILGIRALGETDLNPVSGIGKLSQLLFTFVLPKGHPGAILLNIVAGGVAEAGAQQAGDLMQDLKTGHLLNASPKAQFLAQLVGTVWSIILSSVVYMFYNRVYTLPNEQLRIPTAVVWVDCARLVNGKDLPANAMECSLVAGTIFAFLSLIKNVYRETNSMSKWIKFIPSGVAVGVGIYNSPSFTIARFIGGLVSYYWCRGRKGDLSAKTKMIVFSSGLVLGEGIFSIANMLLTTFNIPHL